MSASPDPLSGIRPLADPLWIVTLLTIVSAGVAFVFGLALGSPWPGLGFACVLIGLALLIAPSGQPNAIYLRAFRTDKATAELRAEISAILGPDFRVAGIRPPSERTSTFMRFFLPGFFALQYAGSKFMELEAGDDWMARLWKTYQSTRLALIDVRDPTQYIQQECGLTLRTAGIRRTIFLIDLQRTEAQWRRALHEIIGPEWKTKELLLLDVSPERVSSRELESDLNDLVKRLPADVPEETESGRQFVLKHVPEESLGRSGRSVTALVVAVVAVLLSATMGLILANLNRLDSLALVLLLVALAIGLYVWLLIRSVARGARRAARLSRAGHEQAARRAWFLLAIASFLFFVGPVCAVVPQIARLGAARVQANEAAAIANIKTINMAEIIYASGHPDVGFTMDLATLGGAEKTINGELASGRMSGYIFNYRPGEKVNGVVRSYTITAVPDQAGTTGQRRFFCDESGEIHYNASGPADATSPVIQ